MMYTLLRNATAVLEYAGQSLLIDPAFDPAGYRPPVANTANQRPNPLVEMPSGWQQRIANVDACLVTHLHQDHFDATAQELLSPDSHLLCQPDDVARLTEYGFTQLAPVINNYELGDISILRTPASHGRGRIAKAMAPVSGFVLRASGEPAVYVAGDTIWYDGVADIIANEQPDVIIVNASGASFIDGGPIVMNAADVAAVRKAAPAASIIVVHLGAINHCHETRAFYRQRLPELGVDLANTFIPDDGETIDLHAIA